MIRSSDEDEGESSEAEESGRDENEDESEEEEDENDETENEQDEDKIKKSSGGEKTSLGAAEKNSVYSQENGIKPVTNNTGEKKGVNSNGQSKPAPSESILSTIESVVGTAHVHKDEVSVIKKKKKRKREREEDGEDVNGHSKQRKHEEGKMVSN